MKSIGIFFGSDTGNTAAIAKKIQEKIDTSQENIEKYNKLIFGIPTWYYGEPQCDWEDFFPTLQKINFSEKIVAIFGCGDQEDYSEYFCDAMGILNKILVKNNAHIVGQHSTMGYKFEASKAPEHHMKRLLAFKFGGIFQICKSFRNSEISQYHNPEFTMLEWYRPNYDMFALMNEVDNFLHKIISKLKKSHFISYRQIFLKYIGIDPFQERIQKIRKIIKKITIFNCKAHSISRDEMLQILFEYKISPNLGKKFPIFVYHFPILQSSMSTTYSKNKKIAERFELYYRGIELANGCCELIDAEEQYKRF
uniref:Flavodoxin-like domain-containing protein n=1 Tax=Glossina palpalis gambiensis TaxID=67801 RepID=A0A1B0C5S4_9MUSC